MWLYLPRSFFDFFRFIFYDQHGWIPLAAAGLTAAATAYGAYQDSKNQEAANEANRSMARETNQMNIDLQNTKHQREVIDLRAAGLNPLLSAGTTGSVTPGVMSNAAPVKSGAQAAARGLMEGVNTASSAIRLKQDLENARADIALKKAGEVTQATQAQLNTSNAVTAKATAEKVALENQVIKSQLPAVAKKAEADLKKATYDSEWAAQDAVMNRAKGWTGVASDAVSALFPKIRINTSPGTDRVIDKSTGEIMHEGRRRRINISRRH